MRRVLWLLAALVLAGTILAVGCSLAPGHFAHTIPAGKRIIQCTVSPEDVNRRYRVDQALIGDAKLALAALAQELANRNPGRSHHEEAVRNKVAAARGELAAKYTPPLVA